MAANRRLDSSGGSARAVGALCIALAMVLTGVIGFRWGSARGGGPDSAAAAATTGSATTSSTGPLSPAQIYARVLPSLVYITVQSHRDGTTTSPAGGDQGVGVGTGLVVSSSGLVLTANHVISGATSIRLAFADGTESAASVMTADRSTDTATLMPDTPPSPIVPAVLGSSDGLSVGDPVVAIGNPLGLAASTSSGVVSGLDRSTPADGGGRLTGLIQFDAAVNPGNSGGPLLDSRGRAVGIVIELLNASGDDSFAGIGLAVPIGTALANGGGPAPQK
jgi:S1-C subfamily serine protease